MGSLTLPKIPVIDFSIQDLKPGTSSWLSTSKLVRYALEEYGCFVALYDQICAQLLNNIFGEEICFKFPQKTKLRTSVTNHIVGILVQTTTWHSMKAWPLIMPHPHKNPRSSKISWWKEKLLVVVVFFLLYMLVHK